MLSCQTAAGEYDGYVRMKLVLPLLLMVVFALSRWPGMLPANFSAAYAIMFCAGLYFPGIWAWTLPLVTMVISDLLLTFFAYPDVQMSFREHLGMMLPNYAGYIGILIIGRGLHKGNRAFVTLVGGGVVGAFLFYIITNSISWLTLPYPKNLVGWIEALTKGLDGYPPTWEFFRSTLMSGGIFSGLFVGAMKLLEPAESPEEKREPVTEQEPAAEEPEAVPEDAKS